MAQTLAPPQPANAIRTGRLFEDLTERIERTKWLSAIASTTAKLVPKVLKPGRVKDFLTGTWMAHPLHPMLTDVAIGAWTSGVFLDLIGAEDGADALIGAGVLAALPTAVTGLSDLADTEGGRERAVGAAHAIGNVTATALFALSWRARRKGARGKGIALSTVATAVATGAGFLGGHLAYRRGIGVDRTVFDQRFPEWTALMREADLKDRTPTRAASGRTIFLLYREGERIWAIDNRCSHRGGPLHRGKVIDGVAQCPWHLSEFSIEDGSIVAGPATAPQPAFEVRVNAASVEVRSR